MEVGIFNHNQVYKNHMIPPPNFSCFINVGFFKYEIKMRYAAFLQYMCNLETIPNFLFVFLFN